MRVCIELTKKERKVFDESDVLDAPTAEEFIEWSANKIKQELNEWQSACKGTWKRNGKS